MQLMTAGVCRGLQEHLQKVPIERQGTHLVVASSIQLNINSVIFALGAITSLGANTTTTFNSVGNTIGGDLGFPGQVSENAASWPKPSTIITKPMDVSRPRPFSTPRDAPC